MARQTTIGSFIRERRRELEMTQEFIAQSRTDTHR